MMRKNLFKTVGQLTRSKGILVISCKECEHGAIKSAHKIRYGLEKERYIDSLRFKCTQCGSRNTLSFAYIPATSEAIETVINFELDFQN
jgi:hypothetical protein